ncbi:hypothetical protein HQ48_07830 [Porphyromonas sp. COT-290 OH3588]|nr:hypothetical protein HQ48_07830 [Porphyromonas sp. COT-290 OH3588]
MGLALGVSLCMPALGQKSQMPNDKERAILNELELLRKKDKAFDQRLRRQGLKMQHLEQSIESLAQRLSEQQQAWVASHDALQSDMEVRDRNSQGKIQENASQTMRLLGGGVAVSFALFLLGGGAYYLLRRRQQSNHLVAVAKTQELEQAIEQSRTCIEEQIVSELTKLTELLDGQAKALQLPSPALPSTEVDHSLALKLAGEITTIERNVSLMDEGTRGLKQLRRSVGKLKDNLAANGYEMPELLNRRYADGMNVIVTATNPNENLEQGVEVISKVLVPQVNYQGKMIQAAQVELSVG